MKKALSFIITIITNIIVVIIGTVVIAVVFPIWAFGFYSKFIPSFKESFKNEYNRVIRLYKEVRELKSLNDQFDAYITVRDQFAEFDKIANELRKK